MGATIAIVQKYAEKHIHHALPRKSIITANWSDILGTSFKTLTSCALTFKHKFQEHTSDSTILSTYNFIKKKRENMLRIKIIQAHI
jgi:hypothetical protein